MKPEHISIIPDGNRRWAKKQGLRKQIGHTISGDYNHLKELLDAAEKEKIKTLSIWAFSTENWNRSKAECSELIRIIDKGLFSLLENEKENQYRVRIIGRRDRLPEKMLDKITSLEKQTVTYKRMTIILAIDYGGRDEIVRAVNKAITKGQKVTEKSFQNYLDTASVPSPDLIIRTGGEKRLSGLFPFQSTYAELIFTYVLFPDFNQIHMKQAIKEFESRKRNFGF